MAGNSDYVVGSWYGQALNDQDCDDYLFQSYSWDAPKLDIQEIDLSEKHELDKNFNINFEDQDFKF